MCGLVGIAGDCSPKFKDVFEDLLIVDSLRGSHSTGMAAVSRFFEDEVKLVKQIGGPHNLLVMNEFKTAINAGARCLIGHNRYATIGGHTIENAHPFVFPSVVGAHNGTLDKDSVRKLYNYDKFGTDSEAIFATINERGLRKTVDDLYGAWALTFYDRETKTINFLRNGRRPLFYCYSEDRCTLIWASEMSMLEYVMNRAKAEAFQKSFYQLPEDEHFSWIIPDSINGKFDQPIVVKMKGPERPFALVEYSAGYRVNDPNAPLLVGGSSQNVLPFTGAQHGKNKKSYSQNSKSNTARNLGGTIRGRSHYEREQEVKKFRPPYKDHQGLTINKARFEKLTKNGCAFCNSNDFDWGDFIHPIHSCGVDSFLCEVCYVDDDVYELCGNIC